MLNFHLSSQHLHFLENTAAGVTAHMQHGLHHSTGCSTHCCSLSQRKGRRTPSTLDPCACTNAMSLWKFLRYMICTICSSNNNTDIKQLCLAWCSRSNMHYVRPQLHRIRQCIDGACENLEQEHVMPRTLLPTRCYSTTYRTGLEFCVVSEVSSRSQPSASSVAEACLVALASSLQSKGCLVCKVQVGAELGLNQSNDKQALAAIPASLPNN